MIFAVAALALIAAGLVAALVKVERGRAGIVGAVTAAHVRALDHADTRRREAEQRAGAAEAELLELRRELATSGYRRYLERHVVVQCHDGRAIRGVLARTYTDGHVIDQPSLADTGQALGGELLIPERDVASMQHLGEADPE